MSATGIERTKAGKLPGKQKDYQNMVKSSLRLHVDRCASEYFGVRGQLVGIAQGTTNDGLRSGGLVVAENRKAVTDSGLTKLSDEETDRAIGSARVVTAPGGSVILWADDQVHGNAGFGTTVPATGDGTTTMPLDEAIADPAKVIRCLDESGYVVVPGVLTEEERVQFVDDAVKAVMASVANVGPDGQKNHFTPIMGFRASALAKMYGIPCNHNVIPWHMHPNVIALFRAMYKFLYGSDGEQVCFSLDALAFQPGPNGDLTKPTRATLINTYGPAMFQKTGTGKKKLAYIKEGGTCNHSPTEFEKGGRGNHYSNKGGLWKPQKPDFTELSPDTLEKLEKLLGP